jgi:hypothetical protein
MLLASSGDMICPHIDHISGHPAICLFVCKAYMIRKGRRGKCRDQIVAEEPHEIALLFLFSSKVSISRTADGEKRVAKGRERSRSRWCTGRFCVASAPAVVEGIDAHLADKILSLADADLLHLSQWHCAFATSTDPRDASPLFCHILYFFFCERTY